MLTRLFSSSMAAFACSLAILSVGTSALSAQADSISLPKDVAAHDDVSAQYFSFSYDGTTKVFSLTGTASIMGNTGTNALNGSTVGFTPGNFTLTAHLTSTGTVDTSVPSTLEVDGLSSSTSVLYKSNDLLEFGFAGTSSNASFQFLFGQDAIGDFSSIGDIGVNITGQTTSGYDGTANSFGPSSSFSGAFLMSAMGVNYYKTNADVYTVVPLPLAAWSGLSILPLILVCRRRRLA